MFKHKGNNKLYARKNLMPYQLMIKQTSDCEWEEAVAYFNPMEPSQLVFTGRDRFSKRFENTKVEYNGDELYDDVFGTVYYLMKSMGKDKIDSSDIANAVIRKIQPKIEALNCAKEET